MTVSFNIEQKVFFDVKRAEPFVRTTATSSESEWTQMFEALASQVAISETASVKVTLDPAQASVLAETLRLLADHRFEINKASTERVTSPKSRLRYTAEAIERRLPKQTKVVSRTATGNASAGGQATGGKA